jgi:hypothetical protein
MNVPPNEEADDGGSVASVGDEADAAMLVRESDNEEMEASGSEDEGKAAENGAEVPAPADAVGPQGFYEDPRDIRAPVDEPPVDKMRWGPDIVGEARRTLGPTPLALFRTLIQDELLEEIVGVTNESARARLGDTWMPLTISEFWRWLALVVAMGIHALPGLRDYWSETHWGPWLLVIVTVFAVISVLLAVLGVPQFKLIMTGTRFRQIKSNLHFVRPNGPYKNHVEIGDPRYDRMWKVRPLIEHVNANIKLVYAAGEFLALDEMMIPSKSKLIAL